MENNDILNNLLKQRGLNEIELQNFIFSEDLDIYNKSSEKIIFPNVKLVNHFPNIKLFNNLSNKLSNKINISLYVLILDNDEIFINYDSDLLDLEEEFLKIGKSIFRDYLPIWSKKIISLYFTYRNDIKDVDNLNSDIRETSFFEFLEFIFSPEDSISSGDIESGNFSIKFNPVVDELILDDVLRIVLDPITLKNIDSNHRNTWIKITNPSYLIYPYYDGKNIKEIMDNRNYLYKNNKINNAIAEHFLNHPNRFLLKNINNGYFNFLWIPFNYVIHPDGTKQYINEIPNNEGNLQIINHFPNADIIHPKVFYNKYLGNNVNFLRKRYIITKGENPENILKELSNNFSGIWSVKTYSLSLNYNYKLFDRLNELKDYVILLENDKNNINGIVIEKYGEYPLLYNGRKFSVNIRVLINNDKSLYISPFMFVITSSEKYNNKLSGDWNKDKLIHISRTYIQSKAPNFGKYEEGNVISIYDISDDIYSRFFPQWKSIILKCYEQFKDELITTDRKYFELLNFIFDIDENMKTYLSDISTNVVSKWNTKWSNEQANIMLNDMMKIVFDPFYNLKNIGNSWIKISEPIYNYYIDLENSGPIAENFLKKRKGFINDIPENLKQNDKRKWNFIYNKILNGEWNFLWFKTEMINIEGLGKKSIFTLPNPKNRIQIVNHLPNISFITNKVNLTKTLTKIPGSDTKYGLIGLKP